MVCTPEDKTCIILMLALVLTCYSALPSASSSGTIGVDYGLNGDNLLTPVQTVELLCSRGIKRVRTYEARHDVIRAFANTGIDLMIGVPDEDVPKLAANSGEAIIWVNNNVLPFPTSGISTILVGNEWLTNDSNDPGLLVPAMINIYKALSALQPFHIYLSGIKVSTPHSFAVLNNSTFPPSNATFADGFVAVMRPLIDFLQETESFFMVNIFPYFTYLKDGGVSLELALFETTAVITDSKTGLKYTNLFDLQLDAVYAAITAVLSSTSSSSICACNLTEVEKTSTNKRVHIVEAAVLKRLGIKVGETGWSSGGGSAGTPPGGGPGHTQFWPSRHSTSELSSTRTSSSSINAHQHASSLQNITAEEVKLARCASDVATVENARTYNQNLIRHVLQAEGTPAHPTTPISAYIFGMFNEDLKPAGTEQHFGLFFPNGTAVYPINFTDRGM